MLCWKKIIVRRLYDLFLLYQKDVSPKIKAEAQKNWCFLYNKLGRNLHDSFVERKRPEDLMICFLSGPEPDNDFQELINLGILPQNIWGFESKYQAYKKGNCYLWARRIPTTKNLKTEYRNLFSTDIQKFDIVYIDACGSVPSTQHALRCVSTLCQNHRLNSPGVIVTNFSMQI